MAERIQYFTKRVGKTTFKVSVAFSENNNETFEEKTLRLVQNEALENAPKYGTIEAPQTSCTSGRSA